MIKSFEKMNSEIFTIPPRSIMEIYQNLPRGTRGDLIEYIIYLLADPGPAHEAILESIHHKLSHANDELAFGRLLIWPATFFLDETSHAIRPDIAVTLKSNPAKIISDEHVKGVPDFVIEILSPVNKRHDLVKKKSVYQRFGVKEYWIIDPETRISQKYALRSGQLRLEDELEGCIRSEVLNIEVDF